MKHKKNKIAELLMLLLLITVVLASCEGKDISTDNGGEEMQAKKTSPTFSEIVESGNLSDLNLTIYYINPVTLTRRPMDVNDLINSAYVKKIMVSSSCLEEHIDLLIRLNDTPLVPVERESYLDTRLCYVFETKKGGRVFEVGTGGVQLDEKGNYVDLCTFVNGLAVIDDNVFYDVIKPFLTEDADKELAVYFR